MDTMTENKTTIQHEKVLQIEENQFYDMWTISDKETSRVIGYVTQGKDGVNKCQAMTRVLSKEHLY